MRDWSDNPAVRAALEVRHAQEAARPDEQWAGVLLTSILGGDEWIPRDQGSGDGIHDLDVLFRDGSRVAVEVTTHTSEARAAFEKKLESVNPVPAGCLSRHWAVGLEAPEEDATDIAAVHRRVDRARAQIVPILEQIEHQGLFDKVGVISDVVRPTTESPLISALQALGVSCAFLQAWSQEAQVQFTATGSGTSAAPNAIANAVDSHIPPNLAKLQRAKEEGAEEAHLFLWLPTGVGRSDSAELSARISRHGTDAPRETSLRGLDSVWVAPTGFPPRYWEIHGYSWPIWQLDPTGWHLWDRSWVRVARGR